MNTQPLSSTEALEVDFFRYMRTLKSRWLLIALLWGGTVGLAGIVASMKPPIYEASSKILIRVDPTSNLTGVGRGVGELESVVKSQNPLTTEVEIIASNPVVNHVIRTLKLQDEVGHPLSSEAFKKNLTVKISGGADIINLSYRDGNPEIAAVVVNALAKTYINDNILDNQRQTSKARGSIEEQLPESQTFMAKAEADLRRFREMHGIISLEEESRSILNVLEALDLQVSQTQAALDEATTEAQVLQSNLDLTVDQAMIISDISQSEGVQAVLQELQRVERQKALQEGIYTTQSPTIMTATAQEVALKRLLQEEMQRVLGDRRLFSDQFMQVGELRQMLINQFLDAEVRRLSLASRLQSLANFRNNYRQRASNLPILEQQQAELERTLEVARSTYQNLLQRLKELEGAEKQAIGNASVIEPALVPEEAISGERSTIIALGGLLGAFLATTVVTLLTLKEENRWQQIPASSGYLPGAAPRSTPSPMPPGSPPATRSPQERPESSNRHPVGP